MNWKKITRYGLLLTRVGLIARVAWQKNSLPVVAPGQLPHRAHPGDAGLDLRASEDKIIPPGGRALVRTGVRVGVPFGHVGFVCSRSGLASDYGVHVLNAPGVVDPGYRGEVMVNLYNTGDKQFLVTRGERVAQLVISPVVTPKPRRVKALPASSRDVKGHGSSGR